MCCYNTISHTKASWAYIEKSYFYSTFSQTKQLVLLASWAYTKKSYFYSTFFQEITCFPDKIKAYTEKLSLYIPFLTTSWYVGA